MEYLNDVLVNSAYVVGGYFGLLTIGALFENFLSQRINSKQELEVAVGEESRKLSLDDSNLIVNWIARDTPEHFRVLGARSNIFGYDVENDEIVSASQIDGKNVREIKVLDIKEGWGARRGVVRHELYHLKRHLPRPNSWLLRKLKWLYQEPAAEIYAVSGIKL